MFDIYNLYTSILDIVNIELRDLPPSYLWVVFACSVGPGMPGFWCWCWQRGNNMSGHPSSTTIKVATLIHMYMPCPLSSTTGFMRWAVLSKLLEQAHRYSHIGSPCLTFNCTHTHIYNDTIYFHYFSAFLCVLSGGTYQIALLCLPGICSFSTYDKFSVCNRYFKGCEAGSWEWHQVCALWKLRFSLWMF